ncbi:hypothetical protein [Kitasatospora sp. MBT66]|uniref:hypothetical protein n=1 Tax=Kitasatospora sp. MBT66 TaxID=1444769 RepID=UPI0005BE24B9|nr:hypothetical protein [Kitasatospora sp. MBT66]
MHQIIGWLLSRVRTLLAPGTGQRARRPQHRTALRETALALITPPPTPEATHLPAAGLRRESPAHHLQREEPIGGTLVRPYVDRDAWRRELDEIQAAYEASQLEVRRAAAAAAAAGYPDPGYTYPGAHTLAGAVA